MQYLIHDLAKLSLADKLNVIESIITSLKDSDYEYIINQAFKENIGQTGKIKIMKNDSN